MAKDSFVIYSSFYKPISRLSDKQLGRLFRAIFKYNLGEVVDVEEDIEMAFGFFVNQFEIDEAKYQGKIMRDIENGRKGGNPNFKRGQSNPYYKKEDNQGLKKITQDNPRLSEITQDKAINENENVNDNVNDNNTPHSPQGGGDGGCWREKLRERFFSKQMALESFCMSNHISQEELRRLAEEVFDEWELASEKDLSERHLINTLRVKINIRNATDKQKQNISSSGAKTGIRSKLPPEPGYGLIED